MSEGQTQRIRRLREALFLVTDDTVLDIIEAVMGGAKIHRVMRSPFLGGGLAAWSVIKPYDKPCSTCGGSGYIFCQTEIDGSKTYGSCPTCHSKGGKA